jgi:predicted ATP-grasp superfamily ATP-dependent carboligase
MVKKKRKVLISGFNARPLAKSLFKADYDVYAVDFFGDSDLYKFVKDAKIIFQELKTDYQTSKSQYSDAMADLTVEMIEKHPELDYLIVGSGLDDNIIGREKIFKKIKDLNHKILYLGNNNETIEKSRDILRIYSYLDVRGYKTPKTRPFDYKIIKEGSVQYPFILKKKQSSGGISIFEIKSKAYLQKLGKDIEEFNVLFRDWFVQEYIDGIDVSCTTISNNHEAKIISINNQIIGAKYLNAPSDFVYCGNIVPTNIRKNAIKRISEISLNLVERLNLIGINGFDFVLKAGYPYLMEINPRIPGSIRASELYLDRNLLQEHILSCLNPNDPLKLVGRTSRGYNFVAKLVYFAPKFVSFEKIEKLKNIKHVKDIPSEGRSIHSQEPLCSVLYGTEKYTEAFCGGLNIIKKIEKQIN